jgi:hypothetical protein
MKKSNIKHGRNIRLQSVLTFRKPALVHFGRVYELLVREDHLLHSVLVFLCFVVTLSVLYFLQLLPLILLAVVPEVKSRLTQPARNETRFIISFQVKYG